MKRLLIGALVALLLAPSMAFSASMTWKLRSYDKHAVDVEFYSKNRKHIWPGGGEVYVMRDYEVKHFKISCVSGEKICYGAWVRGNSRSYWGVGKGGTLGCKSCCYTCEDGVSTPILNLNE